MNVNKVVVMGRLTYDPEVRQSGNGKDPSKVDRSAAYMANYIARDLVKNHGLKSCEVQIACAIGESAPMSVSVKSSSQVEDAYFAKLVEEKYDLTPAALSNTSTSSMWTTRNSPRAVVTEWSCRKERRRTNESGVKIPRRKVANIRMDYLTFSRTQSIL